MWKRNRIGVTFLFAAAALMPACSGTGQPTSAAEQLVQTATAANQRLAGMSARHEIVTDKLVQEIGPPVLSAAQSTSVEVQSLASLLENSQYTSYVDTLQKGFSQVSIFAGYLGVPAKLLAKIAPTGGVHVNDYEGGTCDDDAGCTGGTCSEDPDADPNEPSTDDFASFDASSYDTSDAPEARTVCHSAVTVAEIACDLLCLRKFCLSKTKRTACIGACTVAAAVAGGKCDLLENAT
ncbi:MAG TPA: hypothetical protein VGL86_12030 [Polyangia bacterium]|jgi:hypothetical protein